MSSFDSSALQLCVARLVAIRNRDNIDVNPHHWAELLQNWHDNVNPLDFHALQNTPKDADFLHDCYLMSGAYNKLRKKANYAITLRTQSTNS
jgi:hypothetical protein